MRNRIKTVRYITSTGLIREITYGHGFTIDVPLGYKKDQSMGDKIFLVFIIFSILALLYLTIF